MLRRVWNNNIFILKIPPKWENFAHNSLICFFQHNYISTFEQWLWDRVCVLSTWFGDICGSRKDFCMFYKRSRSLISNSIRCDCLRTDQCNIACPKAAVNRNALEIDRRPPARRRRTVPCDLRRASLPVPLYCFLMVWCGIHSLQWSTIPRIGRHSAGYS